MKKIYLLCLAMMGLFALQANAQSNQMDNTFQFQDANGNEVKDGTTLTLSTLTDGQIKTGLYIKNTSGKKVAGNLRIDLTNMPNGSVSSCGFGLCMNYPTASVVDGSNGVIEADAAAFSDQTEWIPTTYGDWTATMQLIVREVKVIHKPFGDKPAAGDITGYGPKVTLHFVYADPTGINGISSTQGKKVAAVYNASGARLTDMQKGLNIVKYTDGTTAKVMK